MKLIPSPSSGTIGTIALIMIPENQIETDQLASLGENLGRDSAEFFKWAGWSEVGAVQGLTAFVKKASPSP